MEHEPLSIIYTLIIPTRARLYGAEAQLDVIDT